MFVLSDLCRGVSPDFVLVRFELEKGRMGSTAVDEQFKILLVGESGVGKSAILLRYTEDTFDDIPPTIGKRGFVSVFVVKSDRCSFGNTEREESVYSRVFRSQHLSVWYLSVMLGVDFKTKKMEIDDKKVKLTLWDTGMVTLRG